MKVQTKSWLGPETRRALAEAARRTRRSQSEIVEAALASYLSPDGSEAQEAAIARRLDRMTRELERVQRDLTIATEAVGLFARAWMTATPVIAEADQKAQHAKGQERYAGFLEALSRRLASGRLLRTEISEDRDASSQS